MCQVKAHLSTCWRVRSSGGWRVGEVLKSPLRGGASGCLPGTGRRRPMAKDVLFVFITAALEGSWRTSEAGPGALVGTEITTALVATWTSHGLQAPKDYLTRPAAEHYAAASAGPLMGVGRCWPLTMTCSAAPGIGARP
jgi:hypothetical protein